MTLRWQATGVVDEKYGWNNLVNSASFVTLKESRSLWTTQMNSERSLGSVMNEEREIPLPASAAKAFGRPDQSAANDKKGGRYVRANCT